MVIGCRLTDACLVMAREERIASNAKVPEGVSPLVSDKCNALGGYRRCERMNEGLTEMKTNYYNFKCNII